MTPHSRTVVLLHSLGLDADSWTEMRVAAHPLMPAANLIAIDLDGHGTSSGVSFELDRAVAATVVTARSRGAEEPLHLVGSGLGALVALHIASRDPATVASMVLAGWPPSPPPPGRSRADLVAAALSSRGATSFAAEYFTQIGARPDARQRLTQAMVTASANGLVPGIAAAEAWTPAATDLTTRPPSLVVLGAQDVRVQEQDAARFATTLDAALVRIPDAGHLAYVDQPIEFAATLADFYAKLV